MKKLFFLAIICFAFSCKDTDGDGVYDKNDDCIKVAGVEELDGCPDSDEDGIRDSEDDCPYEAGLSEHYGCPDSDEDGIIDSEDECPYEYGDEDAHGCPDKDEDGVKDSEDDCPYEYGYEQYNGCPDRGSIKLSMINCFKALSMTNREIANYCNTFNVNQNEIITYEMCETIADYINNVQRPIAGGYIQRIKSTSMYGSIVSQTLIVLKNNMYYLMEVQGGGCTMGTMIFNENTIAWQEVWIRESPNEESYSVHQMRIIDKSSYMSSLE